MSTPEPETKSRPTVGPTIGMGILSWHGHQSLENALQTYADEDLFSLFDECVIFLPEPDADVRRVAQKFPLRIEEGRENAGIFAGMCSVAQHLNTDYILFLENDCPLIESHDEAERQLNTSLELLAQNDVIVARMRSVRNPGEAFDTLDKYKRYFDPGLLPALRRTLRPSKANRLSGTGIYQQSKGTDPAQKHAKFIKQAENGFYRVSTRAMPWTNQSILIRRSDFLDIIVPYAQSRKTTRKVNGFKNLEVELNQSRFWTQSGWDIACGPGLFTHARVGDRGY